ncbi:MULTISPECIES: G5 domain-containing protein [Aerococcus]|nr:MULTISPECIES: G5 domain-containing protein [Aerococcus]MDK7049529.1 G5 domain-containing protein [Aerococcus sanguinicola]OFT96511.1 hypothetical protein HMPREF3090_02650 [Aerococcus sp. HMSC23C02]
MKNKETLSFRKVNLGLASVALAGFLAANPQVVEATGTADTGAATAITTAGTAEPTTAPSADASNAGYQIQDPQEAEKTLELVRNTRNTYYDDETVPFAGTSLKDYVTKQGLTKEQYINDIRYDRMNEKDAYIRAEETAIHGKLDHKGPDGVSEPQYHNSNAWGENLSFGRNSVEADFEAWTTAELPALKSANGKFTGENGHLYQILNPFNISFGYGRFSKNAPGVDASKYKNAYDPISALTLSMKPGDTDYPAGKLEKEKKTEPIPFEVERIEDSTLEKGKNIVKQEGEDGLRDSTGVVIRQPKNKIILVGTKEPEKTTTPVTPGPQPEPIPEPTPTPEPSPTPKLEPTPGPNTQPNQEPKQDPQATDPANEGPIATTTPLEEPDQKPDPSQPTGPVNTQPTNTNTPNTDPKKESPSRPVVKPTSTSPSAPSKPSSTSPSAVAPMNTEPTEVNPSAVAPSQDKDPVAPVEDQTPVSAVKPGQSLAKPGKQETKPGKVSALVPKEAKQGQAQASQVKSQSAHSVLPKTGAVAVSFTGFGLALVAAGAALLKRRK